MFIMKCLKEVLISHPSPIALAKKHDDVFSPQKERAGIPSRLVYASGIEKPARNQAGKAMGMA